MIVTVFGLAMFVTMLYAFVVYDSSVSVSSLILT
jgi:hypothetical protein